MHIDGYIKNLFNQTSNDKHLGYFQFFGFVCFALLLFQTMLVSTSLSKYFPHLHRLSVGHHLKKWLGLVEGHGPFKFGRYC